MEPQEVDSALDELENRLDRLRSLYEQYFMGIEKIEPTVPRKDVDRRFWILRRTQIRNTARRFRLQTLVQRYNTFQQHWTRICREIENGTYVRHLLKAQKNQGAEPKTWAAKKRLGFFRRDRVGPDGAPLDGASPSGESRPPPSNGRAGSSRPSIPPSIAPSRNEPAPLLAAEPAPPAVAERRSTESVAAFRLQQTELKPLDLDLDDDAPTLPPPPRAAKPVMPAVRAPVAPALPQRPARPAAPAEPLATIQPSVPRPAAPSSAKPAPPRPQPAASAVPRPTQGADARPPTPRAAPPVAPRPMTTAAVAPKPAANAAPAAPGGLSDERVRQLHAELSAARKQLNQGASPSIDSLAKTLRDTETKLRSQHGGKSVDFQVVIKDGKPIVKPVVRR